MRSLCSAMLLLVSGLAAGAAPPGPRYHSGLTVSAPTRLGWTFVLSNRSLTRVPEGWLAADYDSRKQTYDLWVPARKDSTTPLPLIVFLAPGSESAAFKTF